MRATSDDPPLVSIYLPTRGRPALLERALRSALAQDYEPIEVVVAVDGPDEETEALLAAAGARDERVVRVVLPEPAGACAARNAAIEAARGTLITGLDDDDELLPNHVSRLVSAFDPARDSFVCTTSVARGKDVQLVRHSFEGPVELGALLERNVVGNQVLTLTDRLRAVGGFDSGFPAWQDYDLWVRLAERFGPGRKLDARTYVTHADHEQSRITNRDRIRSAHAKFVDKHRSLLGERQRLSLELLMLANCHERFPLGKLVQFVRVGLGRRAIEAYLSDRSLVIRYLGRRWLAMLSRMPRPPAAR